MYPAVHYYRFTLLLIFARVLQSEGLDLSLHVNSRESSRTRVYLEDDRLVLAVKLVATDDPTDTGTRELLSMYNTSHINPVVTLSNSSWVQHFTFNNMDNDSMWWNLTVPRKHFTYMSTMWFPKEQWLMEVSLQVDNSTRLVQTRTLLDTLTEPILQWSPGINVSSPLVWDYQRSDQLLTTQSPCTADVRVIAPRLNHTHTGFHIGVTYDAFDTDPQWYFISGQELCSQGPVSRRSSSGVMCYDCYEGHRYETSYENCEATQTTMYCASATECLTEYRVLTDLSIKLTKQCWVDPVPCQIRVDHYNNLGSCSGPNTANSHCAHCCTGDLCNDHIPGYNPQQTTVPAAPSGITCYKCYTGRGYKTTYNDCQTNQHAEYCATGSECITEYLVAADLSITLTKFCWLDSFPCQVRADTYTSNCFGPNTPNSYCVSCCSGDLCNELIPGYPPQGTTEGLTTQEPSTPPEITTQGAPSGITCYKCYTGRGYKTTYDDCQTNQHTEYCATGSECITEYLVAGDMSITLTKFCWLDSIPCQSRADTYTSNCFGPNTQNSYCVSCCSGDLCNEFIPGYPPQGTTEEGNNRVETTIKFTSQSDTSQQGVTTQSETTAPDSVTNQFNPVQAVGGSSNQNPQAPPVLEWQTFLHRAVSKQTARGDDRETLYSEENFTMWLNMKEELQRMNTKIDDIIDSVHDYHTNSFITLYKDQSSVFKIESRNVDPSDNLPKSKPRFPVYEIPHGVQLTTLVLQPDTTFIYAYGRQIWVSLDGGNHFVEVLAIQPGSSVTSVEMSPRQQGFVMVLDNTNMLVGKHGVLRMAELPVSIESLGTVLYDELGSVYKLAVPRDTWNLTKELIPLQDLVQSQQTAGQNPLVLVPFLSDDSYLFEVGVHGSSTSQFSAGSVGLSLVIRDGFECLIQDVSRPSDNLGGSVLSLVHFRHHQPFVRESTLVSPAQLADIDVFLLDTTTGDCLLVISDDSAGGFQQSDVNKTVVLVGSTSILITEYVNTTRANGIAIVTSIGNQHRQQGAWFLVNLGLNHTTGSSVWYTQEGPCSTVLEMDQKLGGKTGFELDVYDRMVFTVTLLKTGLYRSERPVLQVTYSNPGVFETSTWTRYEHNRETITISVQPRIKQKGMMSVRLAVTGASLLCTDVVKTLTFYSGCPCSKKLQFHYPQYISDDDYLHGNPLDKTGRNLLTDLKVNYRPPSILGTAIPTSDHIYNADPVQPVPNSVFKISKETGHFKQCLGKAARAECGCTDEMRLTSDGAFSDCKKRVYRLTYPGQLVLNLTIEQEDKLTMLSDKHVAYITELNNRYPLIEVPAGFEPSPLVRELQQLDRSGKTLYDPRGITITMNGSGLYHFRVEIMEQLSFCNLYTEFQIFIDTEPMAYPVMFIINFGTAFVLGGFLFVLYLYYISSHQTLRVRIVVQPDPGSESCDGDSGNNETEIMETEFGDSS